MRTDFTQLTFFQACTGFTTEIRTELPDFHPITAKVGERGCLAILYTKNPAGFRIVGENGQHFWVAPANVVWGRESAEKIEGDSVKEGTPVQVVQPVSPPQPVKAGPGRPKKVVQ